MKANLPKSINSLSKSELEKINEYYNEKLNDALDKEDQELQTVWLKLCCILLNDTFGFGEDRLNMFLGNWKRIYRWNKQFKNADEQAKGIDEKITEIFKKNGYPNEFIESMKEK